MRPRAAGFVAGFRHAWEGLVHTVLYQRNMKVHVVSAILVGLVGSGIELGVAERVTLVFCVLFVFFAEILNSALEALVDLHTEDFHDRARVTKDAAAAAVLVLSIGTVIVFTALLAANWHAVVLAGARIARQVAAGLPLAALAALLLAGGRRAAAWDHLAAVAGYALLAALATWTTSPSFTGVTALLFTLCVVAARRRHRGPDAIHQQ